MQALVLGQGGTHPPHTRYLLQAVTSPVMTLLLSDTPLFPDPLVSPSPATQHLGGLQAPSPEPLPCCPPISNQTQGERKTHTQLQGGFFKACAASRTGMPHATKPQLLDTWRGLPSLQPLAQVRQQTKGLRQPLEPRLLESLITRALLAAYDCEQAEDEDEHDGQ